MSSRGAKIIFLGFLLVIAIFSVTLVFYHLINEKGYNAILMEHVSERITEG